MSRKTERAPITLRSSQIEVPPTAHELAAQVLEHGSHEQWERSIVAIIVVHERRRPGVSRTRARAAQVIEVEGQEVPPTKGRAA